VFKAQSAVFVQRNTQRAQRTQESTNKRKKSTQQILNYI